jgi:hypothetical protein
MEEPKLPKVESIPKEQLEIMKETIKLVNWKMAVLAALGTKPLVEQLLAQELEVTKLQKAELEFKDKSRGFIASAGDDCSVVKSKLAELWMDAPVLNAGGKNATQSDKEAWLRQQRTANKDLAGLITRQTQVLSSMESFRLETEQARKKVDTTLAVIRLKTAQIEFLGRSI